MLLIFIFAGLPFIGIDVGPWGAVAIGFFLNTGAHYGEILRAGIEWSVPQGQLEAARSTGLTRGQTMRYVALPQAVRNVLARPDLEHAGGGALTSIASVVALPELLFQARQAQSVTYNATPIMVWRRWCISSCSGRWCGCSATGEPAVGGTPLIRR